jgi:hypothetical protein
MTPFLLAGRMGIIIWITLSLMPVEIVFDAIAGASSSAAGSRHEADDCGRARRHRRPMV